jgi:sn-glycerol 3-phosphate transport system substrate-binding protein
MPRFCLIVLIALLALFSVSCNDVAVKRVDGRVQVTFWHSMTGSGATAVEKMAADFNASQDEYVVEPSFQGTYSESLKKLVSSFGTNEMPSLIQMHDVGTQFMADSGVIKTAQEFADAEPDTISGVPSPFSIDDFEPRAIAYYTIDGELQALPFNLSGQILYYDKAAFRDAGLDPERPPETLEQVTDYSQQLLRRNEQGEITRNGIALTISPWTFEQMLAKGGALYANNGNGREDRASGTVFNSSEGRAVLQWWRDTIDSGLATDATGATGGPLLALATGKSAMAIASTAAIKDALGAIAAINPALVERFGTGSLPGPPASDGGVVLGGAAAWIISERPEEEQDGAWAFLKYATSPQVQAQFHVDTGYFPVRVSSWNMEPARTLHEQFPQYTVARDQLMRSPINPATNGAVIGPFTKVRDSIEEAFEHVLLEDEAPEVALERAAEESDREIERYNRFAD